MTSSPHELSRAALLVRVKPRTSSVVRFTIDGHPATAHVGDTVLTAVLLHQAHLRPFEFGDGDRAGFCLMGACQDCWVWLASGARLCACTTPIEDGQAIVTRSDRP